MNTTANAQTGGPLVPIDGADPYWNDQLAPRITGDFAGSAEDILRWASCKWGIDETVTKARAWTESSWRITTYGDRTDYEPACDYLGLETPCEQSYGLLQVKGTVHEGTYPYAHTSTAWGVDYAMAWQRACYEGSFLWLGPEYGPGNLEGCIGAWYSGNWFDDAAKRYLKDFKKNLESQPWR